MKESKRQQILARIKPIILECSTYTEVGERLGVTKERIRQLIAVSGESEKLREVLNNNKHKKKMDRKKVKDKSIKDRSIKDSSKVNEVKDKWVKMASKCSTIRQLSELSGFSYVYAWKMTKKFGLKL